MIFSKNIFWDVELDHVDKIQHANFIIARIAQYGTTDDWNSLIQEYGPEKVKTELLKTRYLNKQSIDFCSRYFNIPKEQFRCYTLMQSNQIPWQY